MVENSNMSTIFGQRLRERRENQGLYQEDVGEWFKMKKSTVSQWENGRLPHATIIAELAKRFNCTTDYLLGCTDNPSKVIEQTNREDEPKNPDIRLISRAGDKLSPQDAKKLREMAEVLFPEVFKDGNSK